MEWTLISIMMVIAAALVAVVVRFWDSEYEAITFEKVVAFLKVLVVMLIAAFLMAWVLYEEGGISVTSWQGFLLIVVAAAGGIETIKALINKVQALVKA